MKFVVFSIKPMTLVDQLDFLKRVSSDTRLEGNPVQCWGRLDPTMLFTQNKSVTQLFMMTRKDFETCVKPYGWADGQPVLSISECNKMYASLTHPDGRVEPLGSMHQAKLNDALIQERFVHRNDMKATWVPKAGNPDNSMKSTKKEAENV